MRKQNWFNTLNDSINSEDLMDEFMSYYPYGHVMQYGESIRIITDNFILISIYRHDAGMYERPVNYKTI